MRHLSDQTMADRQEAVKEWAGSSIARDPSCVAGHVILNLGWCDPADICLGGGDGVGQ